MAPPKKHKYPKNKIQCSKCKQWKYLNSEKILQNMIDRKVSIFGNGGGGSEDVLRAKYKCRQCRPKKLAQKPAIKIRLEDGNVVTPKNYSKYLK